MAKRRSVASYLTELQGDQPDRLIPISQIVLPQSQPRRYFDIAKLELLIESVRQHGILQPLLVRPFEDMYQLVAGERRYRAALTLKLENIPVTIRELSDREATALSLIENLHREDLNPVEETEAILALLELELDTEQSASSVLYSMLNDKRRLTHNVESQIWDTVEETFKNLSVSWVSFTKHKLPLLKLPEEILQALRQGKLEYTKARAIARIKDEVERNLLLERAIAERLSLNDINQAIAELKPDKPNIQKKLDETYKRLKKSRFWEDPKKRAQVEELLKSLEKITDDN